MTTNGKGKFRGFPRGTQFTPVPNPLLSSLLEDIKDVQELKVILRSIWLIHRKKGLFRSVTASELCADSTVAAMLDCTGSDLERTVNRCLESGTQRGIFIRYEAGKDAEYIMNTPPNRTALMREGMLPSAFSKPEIEIQQKHRLNFSEGASFRAYEDNIGMLTPMAVENIRDAIERYGEPDIVDAIQAAVSANARNWNYVLAFLRRRGEKEGYGKPGRDTQEKRDTFIADYLEGARTRGNR